MLIRIIFLIVCTISIAGLSSTAFALGYNSDEGCLDSSGPVYSNVQFDVVDITNPGTPLAVKGVLTQPVHWVRTKRHSGCFMLVENPPAIVILHDSGGMDTRNAFYAQKLQSRFATLSVEMFEGSISSGVTGRPELPLFNYSHAFGALKFLVEVEGFIAENGTVVAEDHAGSVRKVAVAPNAVGCLGLSWGGVICNQVATELYSQQFADMKRIRCRGILCLGISRFILSGPVTSEEHLQRSRLMRGQTTRHGIHFNPVVAATTWGLVLALGIALKEAGSYDEAIAA